MTEDIIRCYDTFNTKECPEKMYFFDFNDQLIPSNYYNFLNNDNDNVNNILGTLLQDTPLENK